MYARTSEPLRAGNSVVIESRAGADMPFFFNRDTVDVRNVTRLRGTVMKSDDQQVLVKVNSLRVTNGSATAVQSVAADGTPTLREISQGTASIPVSSLSNGLLLPSTRQFSGKGTVVVSGVVLGFLGFVAYAASHISFDWSQ